MCRAASVKPSSNYVDCSASLCACYAEWGQDFRPEYMQLGMFKDSVAKWMTMGLPKIPIVALTATATKPVQAEIMTALHFDDTAKVS